MNLTLYFRLIVMTLFQKATHSWKQYSDRPVNYQNVYFYCPRVFAKDGFNVSLQIHNSNYCSSENGYREFGHTWKQVEFGFPSENEPLMHKYAELYGNTETDWSDSENPVDIPFDSETFDIRKGVGIIPVSVMEEVFAKHGGIDWEKTLSVEQFENFTKHD